MSGAVLPVKAVRVYDPRLEIDRKRLYVITDGGQTLTYKQFTTNSFSNSSINFSSPPPNQQIGVQRSVILKVPVRITLTGTTAVGSQLLLPGYGAFRAYPLASVIDTLTVTINNSSNSVNLSDFHQALIRYANPVEAVRESYYSTTPSGLDQSQQYSDLVGSVRNPLGNYYDSNDGAQTPRGGFKILAISNPVNPGPGTAATVTIDAVLSENLWISPLSMGQEQFDQSALFGVQTFDCIITLGNLSRMWSQTNLPVGAGAQNVATVSATITGQPSLLFTYITPHLTQKIPDEGITYDYFTINRYPTNGASMLGMTGGVIPTQQIASTNINLSGIPRRIYVYARRQNSERSAFTTDSFLPILNCTVQLGNISGIMASASQEQLYLISAKNGCNMSWEQWSGGPVLDASQNNLYGTVGSVLAIDPAEDLGLDELSAPGNLLNTQLQITVNVQNVSTDSFTPTLYIVVANEGIFTIEKNYNSITQTGVLTKEDILDAKVDPDLEQINVNLNGPVGGASFLSKLKKVYKRARPFIPIVEGAISAAAPEFAPIIAKERALREALGGGKVATPDSLYRRLMINH